MSLPINQQHELIKKYFNLLVAEFIKNPIHKDISLVFKNYLGKNTLGHTRQKRKARESDTNWWVVNGAKVPGSEQTTYYPCNFKYIISFLNNYQNDDELRGTVVHEFIHLYLYSTVGNHTHDDRFYSQMERLEKWLDKQQGFKPRLDKSQDRNQYVADNNNDTDSEEDFCPECAFPILHHSSECSQITELDYLRNLLETSPDLATLENNYQTVQANPLYLEINNGENSEYDFKDNKRILDTCYQTQKVRLQLQNNQFPSINASEPTNNWFGKDKIFWSILIIGTIIFLGIVIYLVSETSPTKQKKKKKQ